MLLADKPVNSCLHENGVSRCDYRQGQGVNVRTKFPRMLKHLTNLVMFLDSTASASFSLFHVSKSKLSSND